MKGENFFDGTSNITVMGGMVRVDLGVLVPDPNNSNQPVLESRERFVTPLNGFIKMYDDFTRIMQRLEENGLVKRNNEDGGLANITE